MRRIIEERGAENILHVGARAYAKEELGFASEHQISTITDEDIRAGNGAQMVSEFLLKHKSTYATLILMYLILRLHQELAAGDLGIIVGL